MVTDPLGPHRPDNAASPQSIWMPPDGRARMPLTAQQYCPLFSSTSLSDAFTISHGIPTRESNTMVVLIYDKTIPVRRKEYIHYNNRCA